MKEDMEAVLIEMIILHHSYAHFHGRCHILTRNDGLQKSSSAEKRSLRDFRKRVLLYESAGAAVLDDFFNGMWTDL